MDLEGDGAGKIERGAHEGLGLVHPVQPPEDLGFGAERVEVAWPNKNSGDGIVGPFQRLFVVDVGLQAVLHGSHPGLGVEAGAVAEFASQAGAKVRSVFRREDGTYEGAPAGDEALMVEGGTEEDHAGRPPMAIVREFMERSQSTFDEWQKRVDERIRHVVETLAPWTVLQKEIGDLTQRLADLEKRLGESDGGPSAD